MLLAMYLLQRLLTLGFLLLHYLLAVIIEAKVVQHGGLADMVLENLKDLKAMLNLNL
jgi:hypothetical protein